MFIMALVVTALAAQAIPAKPGLWRIIKTADGQEVRVQQRGDEHGHFWEDANGNCYVKSGNTFVAANKTLIARQAMAHRAKVAAKQCQRARKLMRKGPKKQVGGATGNDYTGEKKGLIILVEFQNKVFKEEHTRDLYDLIANKENYSSSEGFKGSVHDYFFDQSYGKFDLTFDVVGPITLTNDYKYYGENDEYDNDKRPEEMVVEACKAVDAVVDFADYDWDGNGEVDQVFVLYAGLGEAAGGSANTIWPHEYFLSATGSEIELDGMLIDTYACSSELTCTSSEENVIDGIGTICHEFSHCLGFPDMYDISYTSMGMGTWDLMDAGSYNGKERGFVPAGYSSYEKWCAGWLEPIELTEETEVTDMKGLSEGGEAYVMYNDANHDEFYLLENRQKKGWDAQLDGKGLLVHHIDYNEEIWYWNVVNTVITKSNYQDIYGYRYGDYEDGGPLNSHMRATIVPADNLKNENSISGDTYPRNSKTSLGNTTTPAAILYNANTDGKKLLNKCVYDITQDTSNRTISFKFKLEESTGDDPGIEGENIFHETFDLCNGKGGNDNLWNGNAASSKTAFIPDNDGWITKSEQEFGIVVSYGGNKCAKFGKSDTRGIVYSPNFTIDGDAKVVVRVAPWDNKGTETGLDILLVTDKDKTVETQTYTMTEKEWNEYTFDVKGDGGDYYLAFEPTKRFFIDDVLVYVPSDDPTGISEAVAKVRLVGGRIYTIDGRYVGLDIHALPHGIYIIDGKKVVK